MKKPAVQHRSQRRLSFERCEPRLMLSGDDWSADGGFISLDHDDFLAPVAHDFVFFSSGAFKLDATSWVLNYQITNADVSGGMSRGVLDGSTNNWHSVGEQVRLSLVMGAPAQAESQYDQVLDTPRLSDQELEDVLDTHLFTDTPAETEATETPYNPPELAPEDNVSTNVAPSTPDDVLPEQNLSANKLPAFDAQDAPSLDLPPITTQQALALGKLRVEHEQSLDPAGEGLAEGGPIEVAHVVAEVQRVHEAELFAEVAAQLDAEQALAQVTPPASQPIVGELARAVVFEVVGQEPAAHDSAQRQDASDPRAALPEAHNVDESTALALKEESDQGAESRAMAFAEWPLYISVVLGGMVTSRRRKTQAAATQQPPRRSRQPIGS